MLKHKVVDFIIQWVYLTFRFRNRSIIRSIRFMEEVDKEISEMKLSLNARARIVAESYLTAVRARTCLLIWQLTSFNSSIHNCDISFGQLEVGCALFLELYDKRLRDARAMN